MLIYTSADPSVMGETTYLDAWRAHHTKTYTTGIQTWANAIYTYWPGDIGTFNTDWQEVAAAYPDGVPTLASPKGTPETTAGANALHTFCSAVPAAWRPKLILAYWQEPGNDFGGGGQPAISVYRTRVSAMADVARQYGIRNAVHVEEWDINPFNGASGSTQAERFAHLGLFVQGIADKIDVVSWSLYPAEGNSLIDGMQRMEDWMNQYLPGTPWIVTATSSPVNLDRAQGSPQRVTRAQIVRDAGDYIKTRTETTGGRGPSSFGWFHFTGFAGNNKDNLATTDQALYDALQYVAALQIDEPDPDPPGGTVDPQYVGADSGESIGTATLTVTIPAAAQAGDVALLFVDSMNNTSDANADGWTPVGLAQSTQNVTSRLMSRTLTAGDPGTDVTVNLTQNNIRYNAQMVVYRGVDPAQVVAAGVTFGGTSTLTTPTVAAPSGPGFVIGHVVERANPIGTNFTPPTGVTERLDDAPTFTGVSVRAATGDTTTQDGGTVGGQAWTSTISTSHQAAWTVALPHVVAPTGPVWQVRTAGGAWEPRSVVLI